MRRRRARNREIVFNFDSFLDLVANVVGIILRLILVVWIGARSYSYVATKAKPTKPIEPPREALQAERDKLTSLAEREQLTIAEIKEQMAQREAQRAAHASAARAARDAVAENEEKLASVRARIRGLNEEIKQASTRDRNYAAQRRTTEQARTELEQAQRELRDRIGNLAESKTSKKILRYQTPVAAPIQTQELQFECKDGRVTFLDVEGFLQEILQSIRSKAKDLRSTWRVADETKPIGAFRLRYEVSRQRTVFDSLAGASTPNENEDFRYGLERWVAEPLPGVRGEDAKVALLPESKFREIIDRLDPKTTAVTFWVYPDSFSLYRRLRDYCARKNVLVAGRPLPAGMPIASSRNGTASRGQ